MSSIFKKKFTIKENILEFESNDQTYKKVSDFYNVEPFPSYKLNDNKFTILSIGEKNQFLKQFKNEIGYKKKVLEAGAGTCQLITYIAIGTNNDCYALDSSKRALDMGNSFAKTNNINNITYCKGDILEEIFEENTFDFIWCSGVLHHTKNAKIGFEQLSKYLKKDGIIVIGLYNKYGRFWTNMRRIIYKLFGPKLIHYLDPVVRKIIRNNKLDKNKINSWIRDQYNHPLEKSYTLDDVLKWFEKNNIKYVNSLPQCDFSNNNNNFFLQKEKGSFITRLINQILMLFENYGSEGGLFLVIGKK